MYNSLLIWQQAWTKTLWHNAVEILPGTKPHRLHWEKFTGFNDRAVRVRVCVCACAVHACVRPCVCVFCVCACECVCVRVWACVRASEQERERERACVKVTVLCWIGPVGGYRSIQFRNLITTSSQPHRVISHLRMNEGRVG